MISRQDVRFGGSDRHRTGIAMGAPGRAWRWAGMAILLAGGVLYLMVRESYGAGFGNHTQYLVHAFRAESPDFALGDWFVSETSPQHYLFSYLATAALSLNLLSGFLLVWQLCSLFLLCGAVVAWIRELSSIPMTGARLVTAFLLVVVVMQAGVKDIWGAEGIFTTIALPVSMGTSLALWAWLAALRHRRLLAALLMVGATFAHFQVGVIGTIALALLVVGGAWRRGSGADLVRSWVRQALVFAVLVTPLAVRVMIDHGGVGGDGYRALIFGYFPPHWTPYLSGIDVHVRSLFVLVVAGLGLVMTLRHRRAFTTWMLGLLALMATSVFFVAVVFWPPPVVLYPFRLFPFFILFGAIFTAGAAVSAARLWQIRAMALSALLAHVVYRRSTVGAWVILLVPLVVGTLWSVRGRLPGAFAGAESWVRSKVLIRLPSALREPWLAAAGLVAVMALFAFGRPNTVHFDLRPLSEETAVLELVRDHTPPGSVLVVPPELEGVRLTAERAVVVDWKSIPIGEADEWRERMRAITGLDPAQANVWYRDVAPGWIAGEYQDGFERRTLAELLGVANDYDATHLLLTRGARASQEASGLTAGLVAQDSEYLLLDVVVLKSLGIADM